MKKRILSAVLVLVMVLGMLPGTAFAADSDFTIENGVLTKYNGSGGDVTIPSGVTSIGRGAFFNCTGLTSVTIPDSVTRIGDEVFYQCTGLTSVAIPDSVTSIGYETFLRCTGLTSVTIPDSVTSIGHEAFYQCTGLTSVTIPNSVTSIEQGTFYGCTGLTNVTIPKNVTRIWNAAFSECTSLTAFQVDPDNQNFLSADGVLFSKDMTSLWCYPAGMEEAYTIPNSVTRIESYAFSYCTNLTSVTIPNSVTEIGNDAFFCCHNLTNIAIPNSVTKIGDYAFGYCSSLTKIVIPDGITSLGRQVFAWCENLASVTIPESVTWVGDGGMFGTSTGGSFDHCDSLKSAGPIGSGADYQFGWTDAIPSRAFDGCESLTSVILPSSLSKIGAGAFSGCKSLENITIPEKITTIEGYTFRGCSNLKEITIPANVTEIDDHAFQDCVHLSDVYYSGTEAQWGNVKIGDYNDRLTSNATIHYNNIGPDQPVVPDNPAGDISIKTTLPPYVGGETDIFATIPNPGNLKQSDITWSSSDETVAMVVPGTLTTNIYGTSADATARIRGISSGKTTITIFTADGRSASCEVEVTDGSTGELKNEIQLSGDGSLLIGDATTLSAKITLNTINVADSIEWTSSDPNILTFGSDGSGSVSHPLSNISQSQMNDSVTIYGKWNGKVTVTCRLPASGVQKSITILVYSKESQELQDRATDWTTAYDRYINAVVKLLDSQKTKVTEATKEEQARALMAADQASRDRLVTFPSREDEENEKIALPVYMAVVDMLAEEADHEFSLGNVDVSGADKDTYFTTVSISIVKQVQNMLNTKPYEFQYDNVFIKISGISVHAGTSTARSREISYAVNDSNSSRLVAHFGSRQDELQATVKAYLEELDKLEKNSINEVYSQMVKTVFNKTLGELIKAGVKDKITNTLTPHLDKFEKSGAGNVVTAISTCIDYYKYVDKIIKIADHDPAELLLDLSSMENLKFDSATIKDKTVKAAMKGMDTAKKALEKAIKEYADTGKINWGAVAVGWAKDTFSGVISTFKCPVSISVYDSTGKQIGYVGDDDIWYDSSAVYIEKYGDAKVIYSNDTALRLEAVGLNYGALNCTFEEYSNGLAVGRINYFDIPLYEDCTISAEVAAKNITKNNVTITTEGTSTIEANEIIPSLNYDTATVNISADVQLGGEVIGTGAYVRGDTVNLQAIAKDEYSFQGWENSKGALLSISPIYEFTARENITLTAVFTKCTDEDTTNHYLVIFDATDGSVAPTSLMTESNGKLQVIPVPNRNGYTFDGWYTADGTRITANTVFTADTTVYAHWTKNDTPVTPSYPNSSSSSSDRKPSYPIDIPSHITGGTVKVTPTSASERQRVTLTVKANYGYVLDKLAITDSKGNELSLNDQGNGKYTFNMPKSKVSVNVSFAPVSVPSTQLSFVDVPTNAYYYNAVLWAVEKEITAGTSATTFSPDASCTRAQIVTLLWRAAGSPKVEGENPFSDVTCDSYYYDAVLWAVSKGITSGTSATTFSPDAACTRAQAVTFLYHYEKSPMISGSNAFIDVPGDAYYTNAVQWAVNNGVTAGTSATTFSPDATCTRGQIVTFLYRDMA